MENAVQDKNTKVLPMLKRAGVFTRESTTPIFAKSRQKQKLVFRLANSLGNSFYGRGPSDMGHRQIPRHQQTHPLPTHTLSLYSPLCTKSMANFCERANHVLFVLHTGAPQSCTMTYNLVQLNQ
jgi:hypothetical protein